MKTPYVIVLGDRDLEAGTVTVRNRAGEEAGGLSFDAVVAALVAEAATRALAQTDLTAAG